MGSAVKRDNKSERHLNSALLKTVSTFGLPRVHHVCVAAGLSQRDSDTVTAFHRNVSELNICGSILSSNGRASRRGLKLLLSSLLGVDSYTHHYYYQCAHNQQSAFKLSPDYKSKYNFTIPHFNTSNVTGRQQGLK